MGKAKRVTIAPNIYQYPDGQKEAIVKVGVLKPRAHRFKASTSLEHITKWVAATRKEMVDELKAFGTLAPSARRAAVGTLEGDAPDYFDQIAGQVGFGALRSHVRAWFNVVVDGERLGSLSRDAITTSHANKAITQWQTKPSPHAIRKVRVVGYERGKTSVIKSYVRSAPATSGAVVAAKTIIHRCFALSDLYHTLDGKRAPTPVDEAKVPAPKKTPPVTVPVDVIETVLRKLAKLDPKTYGRFAVMATSAQRPCQVGRAQPDDVQIAERVWLVRDAKGEAAHSVTLDDPQVAAWEAFIAADAWGPFDTSKYGKLIHAAGWPRGIWPYAARHSIAVAAIREGVSLGDVQAMLGHADPATTRRFYAPFQVDRQRAVSKKMRSYLSGVFKLKKVKG